MTPQTGTSSLMAELMAVVEADGIMPYWFPCWDWLLFDSPLLADFFMWRQREGDHNTEPYSNELGFAHGWIWSRESQKEIEKEREAYHQRTAAFQRDLEAKYHTVIAENRRSAAQLSLELEKEQNRTASYREALISQGRKLVEEKKLLEQERAQALQESRQPLRSAYLRHLDKEEDWQRRARLLLRECEEVLVQRQSIYCSLLLPRHRRQDLERSLLARVAADPLAADLGLAAGLADIFQHDTHCGDLWNTDRRRNGRLMWLYLKYWELTVELRKFQRVEKALVEE